MEVKKDISPSNKVQNEKEGLFFNLQRNIDLPLSENEIQQKFLVQETNNKKGKNIISQNNNKTLFENDKNIFDNNKSLFEKNISLFGDNKNSIFDNKKSRLFGDNEKSHFDNCTILFGDNANETGNNPIFVNNQILLKIKSKIMKRIIKIVYQIKNLYFLILIIN